MKKTISLLLVLLMVLCLLCACTPNAEPVIDPVTSDASDSDAEEKQDDMPETYGGQAFYFYGAFFPKAARDYTEEEKSDIPTTYNNREEAMMNKVLATEEKYDCMIIKKSYPTDQASEFISFLATGAIDADFLYSSSSFIRDLYIGGAIADLNKVEAVDLTDSEKWGSATNLALVQYKGEQYGIPSVGSLYWPFNASFYGILMQKNSAFASYETDWTVWEMVENGDWTFDNFLELLPTVSNIVGDDDKNLYGLSYNNGATVYDAALYVNEGSKVVYNEELGKYEFGLLSENALEAYEFARKLYAMDAFDDDGMQISEMKTRITSDHYTFFLTNGYRAFSEIAKMTNDVSWIPFPYGPHSVYGESTSAYYNETADCVTAIVAGGVNDDDPALETQKNGVIFNDLFEPTETYGKTGYDEWLERNYFYDDDGASFSVYKQYSKNIHSSYKDCLGATASQIENKIYLAMYSQTTSMEDVLSGLEDAVNNQLDIELNN